MQRWIYPVIVIILSSHFVVAAHAQTAGNSICVLAYEDVNKNAIRDASEAPLSGVSITVAVQKDIIVQSYITTEDPRPYCFEGLADGDYTLTFQENPNHKKITENTADLSLSDMKRVRVEFGAITQSPFEAAAADTQADATGKLATADRIALAVLGSVLVMVFMLGVGVVVAGFMY